MSDDAGQSEDQPSEEIISEDYTCTGLTEPDDGTVPTDAELDAAIADLPPFPPTA